ncbi:phospholipid-transporting ATPase ABCA1-like [Ixodes scapularis]|uniref:phospholipid-transporting ATPase ABCA1-like n=1 Tax=Ixodes scapularis TaxID=6945 RepID=UPI001A9E7AD8|nr:phospholipid-transporting ATPase ABCA1-like [Ixodes scapularis]
MPTAKLLSKVANEMVFSLGSKKLAHFGHTFRMLREQAIKLGIGDVGFPCRTIEDVLLRVSFMSGETMVPPSGVVYDPKLSIKVHLMRSDGGCGARCRGFLSILRYRMRHFLSYSWFYTLLLASGAFLFLVFSDRVASVRLPLPRSIAPIRMDQQNDFKHGFYRAVDSSAALEEALKVRAEQQGTQLVKVPSATDHSLQRDVSSDFGIELGTQSLVAWYNVRVRQSEVLSLLLLQNAALQQLTASEHYQIQAWREFTSSGATIGPANVFSWLTDVELKIVGATFVPLSLGLFTAAAAIFPAQDAADGGRLLQQLSGLPGPLYWLANMFWDYGLVYHLYLVLLSPMVAIWGYGDSDVQFWLTVVLLFLAYGWASIPFAYLVSKLFTRPSRAFAAAATLKGPLGGCASNTVSCTA